MRIVSLFILIISICTLAGCHTNYQVMADTQTVGKIINTRTNQQISFSKLLSALSQHQFILVGEEHDNKLHHQIEHDLITHLEQRHKLSAVVVEMLDIGQQPLVDKTKHELHTCCQYSATQIQQKLHWKKWDWQQYQQLITHRMKSLTPLLGANLTETEIQTLMQGAQPLQGNRSIQPNVQQKIANLISAQHSVNPELLQKRTQIQQFRDRRMAEILQKQTALSVLIAGNHHVRKDIGVPLHLADYAQQQQKSLSQVTLMLKSTMEDVDSSQADYVWITH